MSLLGKSINQSTRKSNEWLINETSFILGNYSYHALILRILLEIEIEIRWVIEQCANPILDLPKASV